MADRFQMSLDNKQIEQGRAALTRLTPEERKVKREAKANTAKKGASE